MPGKIFCVSFHKSGTTNLHHFLRSAGIKSLHYPRRHKNVVLRRKCKPGMTGHEIMTIFAPVLDSYDAHLDAPWPGLLPEILRTYPDARIILLTRDSHDWWASLVRHWRLDYFACGLTSFEQIQYRDYLGTKSMVRLADKNSMIDAYNRHNERVRKIVPHSQLFESRLDDPALGDRLSSYLKLETPSPFPRLQNKTASKPWPLFFRRLWRFLLSLPANLKAKAN